MYYHFETNIDTLREIFFGKETNSKTNEEGNACITPDDKKICQEIDMHYITEII